MSIFIHKAHNRKHFTGVLYTPFSSSKIVTRWHDSLNINAGKTCNRTKTSRTWLTRVSRRVSKTREYLTVNAFPSVRIYFPIRVFRRDRIHRKRFGARKTIIFVDSYHSTPRVEHDHGVCITLYYVLCTRAQYAPRLRSVIGKI